ncbi:MAG: hypothetical protein VYC44_01440, partial [Chloroflexota bacterium]|nr:hypothetical protein [Chloroflexota bacterium]
NCGAVIKSKMLRNVVLRVGDAQSSEDFFTEVLCIDVRDLALSRKTRFFISALEIAAGFQKSPF